MISFQFILVIQWYYVFNRMFLLNLIYLFQESQENQTSFQREGYLTIIHRFQSRLNGQQIAIWMTSLKLKLLALQNCTQTATTMMWIRKKWKRQKDPDSSQEFGHVLWILEVKQLLPLQKTTWRGHPLQLHQIKMKRFHLQERK